MRSVVLACVVAVAAAVELTFELPDNAKECFHEEIKEGVESNLEFQVSDLYLFWGIIKEFFFDLWCSILFCEVVVLIYNLFYEKIG